MSTERYTFNTDIQKTNFDLKLLYATHSTYNIEWNSKLHTHRNTEIFYVIRGKGLFSIEKETFEIQEDDVIVVNPMIAHTEKGIPNQDFEYIVVGFSGLEFFNEIDNEKGYALANYKDFKHEVLFYFKSLISEAAGQHPKYEIICQNLLEILIINLTRRADFSLTTQVSYHQGKKECVFVERYINSHFKENITLDQLSELTFTNKYHLAHEFKKYKGISCINFLIHRRIEEAKVLLTTTNLNINDISNIIGFSSQSYFTQSFKKCTNMSPTEYKNHLLNKKN